MRSEAPSREGSGSGGRYRDPLSGFSSFTDGNFGSPSVICAFVRRRIYNVNLIPPAFEYLLCAWQRTKCQAVWETGGRNSDDAGRSVLTRVSGEAGFALDLTGEWYVSR